MIKLDSASLTLVKQILQKHLPGVTVKAFGSRVTGKPQPYSDLDLVIVADQSIPIKKMNAIKFEFSNSDLPILVDIIDWHAISKVFREKIQADCETLI